MDTKNNTGNFKNSWSNEQTNIQSKIDFIIEEVIIKGYSIVKNHISKEETELTKDKIEKIYDTQVNECGGEENLKKIGDHHNAKALIAYDDYFKRYVTDELSLKIAHNFLGDYMVLFQNNGILHRPNEANTTSPWHRDIVFQHFTSSRPLAITFLFCISEYNIHNGATMIIPGSHKHEKLPSEKYLDENKKSLIAPEGSMIIFDSMLFHRGGMNLSSNTRYSLNNCYTLPVIRPTIDYPNILGASYTDDAKLRQLLGYNNVLDPDPKTNRIRKIENLRVYQGWKLKN